MDFSTISETILTFLASVIGQGTVDTLSTYIDQAISFITGLIGG